MLYCVYARFQNLMKVWNVERLKFEISIELDDRSHAGKYPVQMIGDISMQHPAA